MCWRPFIHTSIKHLVTPNQFLKIMCTSIIIILSKLSQGILLPKHYGSFIQFIHIFSLSFFLSLSLYFFRIDQINKYLLPFFLYCVMGLLLYWSALLVSPFFSFSLSFFLTSRLLVSFLCYALRYATLYFPAAILHLFCENSINNHCFDCSKTTLLFFFSRHFFFSPYPCGFYSLAFFFYSLLLLLFFYLSNDL